MECSKMAENNEKSYDILEWFPILYCQEVFKYLSGKDIIQASAVNKEWNKFCAESQQTKKLKFKIVGRAIRFVGFNDESDDESDNESEDESDDESDDESEDESPKLILKNSKRKYENLAFDGICFCSDFLSILADRAGSWKSIHLFFCAFGDQETLSSMLRVIEPSVEEFTIIKTMLMPEDQANDPAWTFPCLKSLTSRDCNYNIYKCFAGCTTLVKFHCLLEDVHVISPADATMRQDIRAVLRNNHDLKDVCITADRSVVGNWVEFMFKLQKLRIDPTYYQTDSESLYNLLDTQKQSLETLEIFVGLSEECLELILTKMPKLTSFTADIYKANFAIQNSPLPVNTTIVSLGLKQKEYHEYDFILGTVNRVNFETLIRAFPAVKHFNCNAINGNQIIILSREVPALESIEAEDFYIDRFPEGDIFPNIKDFKVETFNTDMPEPIGDGNFAKLVRESMRNYFAEHPRRHSVYDAED